MTGIDEISRTLGRLEADATSARNQREKIFELIGEVQAVVGAMPSLVTQVNNLTTEMSSIKATVSTIPPLVEKVDEHSVHIEDFKGLKNKALGVLAFIGFLGGSIGAGFGKLMEVFK